MKRIVFIIFLLALASVLYGQVRNGWRSIYDTEGRLTRMYYYENGIVVPDSNKFFQYHTGNHIKAYVEGEILSQRGYVNGSVSLFDQTGKLASMNQGREGHLFFNIECDYYQECIVNWSDNFEVNSGFWNCESFTVGNGEMIVHNDGNMSYAVYNPPLAIDLRNEFACMLTIPTTNSSKQGLALGWEDENNYFLIELSFGTYYTVHRIENGVLHNVTKGRIDIERPGDDSNTLVVRKTNRNLIIEWNGVIQSVLPVPDFKGEKIALLSRSRGDMRVSNFAFSYQPGIYEELYQTMWFGKGTGFFIAPNRILTTYDNIADANKLRIITHIGGESEVLPVSVFRLEENYNIAILSVDDPDFKAFDDIPFGYSDRAPVSDLSVFSIGFPNAISGVFIQPDVFQGKVIHGSTMMSGHRMLELPFRYGMMGAPIFDNDCNFMGVSASGGMDLSYSEMIDFHLNSRLFMANMGKFERRIESPLKDLSTREKIDELSKLVVIIESSVFVLD